MTSFSFSCSLRLWLLACVLCAGLGMAGGARANVVCAPSAAPVSFGTVTVNTPSGSVVSGTVNYTCTSYNTVATPVTLCLDLGNPSWPGVTAQPVMQGPGGSRLNFQFYVDPALSRVMVRTLAPLQKQFTMPAPSNNTNPTVTGSFTFYGLIQGNQTSATAGGYSANFFNTILGFQPSGTGTCQATVDGFSSYDFTIDISATVGSGCVVSATPINFGTVARTAGSAAQNGTITVNCPNQTAYKVGLLPSNGNANGAGVLSGTGSNTEKVPYQLRASTATGSIWGNTATSTTTGNGVAGTGSGSAQPLTVFATVSNTNFPADTYTDTVRVFVNY